MATGLRTCRKAETSVLSMVHPGVLSMVHPGQPCLHCTLCKEKYPVYTHPIKWKNEHLYTLLRELEPNISIQPESCVCRNCRDDLLRMLVPLVKGLVHLDGHSKTVTIISHRALVKSQIVAS